MTASLEEYLKTIYILIKNKKVARVTDIAVELGCTKPSVNRALKILKEEKLINYEAYKDIELTNKGKEVAKDIVRKHDTLKAFLIEALNVEEKKAEEEAKLMKHAISEDTVNKLEEYIQSIIDVDSFICNYNPNSDKCKRCNNSPYKKRKENYSENNKRVLLGMSGGVDSSVSAILLKEQGYDVIGITMELWNEDESTCCGSDAVFDAKRVCDLLDIPHYTINCKDEFNKFVIDDFIKSYKDGKTPNPCIECNKYLKFGRMYQKAKELECEYIATGHYAKIEYSEKYDRYVLMKSDSVKKDQSYVLYSIDKEILPHILFPLAKYEEKDEIRKIAKEHGLDVASKKDSEDICFIPDNDYIKFLKKYGNIKLNKGNIVLRDGTNLGKHDGYMRYTVGQRRGLGISYKEPLYVTKINKDKNEIIVGIEEEIFTNELVACNVNFLAFDKLEVPMKVKAKIRYYAKESEATLIPIDENKVKVVFNEKQRAITPGQSVVFYDDNIVIGGGKIM